MVTVELAFASLALTLLGLALAWVISVVVVWVQCQDLAVGIARQQARGDQAAVAMIVKRRPPGADVSVDQRDDQITVKVRIAAQPWATWLPSVPMTVSATVTAEPT